MLGVARLVQTNEEELTLLCFLILAFFAESCKPPLQFLLFDERSMRYLSLLQNKRWIDWTILISYNAGDILMLLLAISCFTSSDDLYDPVTWLSKFLVPSFFECLKIPDRHPLACALNLQLLMCTLYHHILMWDLGHRLLSVSMDRQLNLWTLHRPIR